MPKPKKPAAKAAPARSPETSKPLCKIEIDPGLIARLRGEPKARRAAVGKAIESVRLQWGLPHAHSGIGIRNLRHGLYECRAGLDQRLLFQTIDDILYFHFLGDHDEVQRFLRSHR